MEGYKENIEDLSRANFKVKDYGNGYLLGDVNSKESGVLQFSTMYDKGWSVFVDGKKVNTFTANQYFLGIEIDKGIHEIKLKYTTPYLFEGLCISTLGITIFVFIVMYKEKSKTNT